MWQLLCAKNRHAHATRQCDRHGIQLGEDPLTTCRQPPCCSWWPRARCNHGGACILCPPQHDRRSRGVPQHFACSGAAAPHLRFWVLSAGASGSVLVHRAPSESIRPARTGPRGPPPPMHPPTPAEHMQCELRKCAFNSSEQHDRHAIQPTEHLPTTCRQPPCCSRCSVLAAAMTPHAHHAPSGSM